LETRFSDKLLGVPIRALHRHLVVVAEDARIVDRGVARPLGLEAGNRLLAQVLMGGEAGIVGERPGLRPFKLEDGRVRRCVERDVAHFHGVPLARGKAGEFAERFNPLGGPYRLREDVLLEYSNPKPISSASVPVNFAKMRDDVPVVVTSLMNELLRSLGHSVVWKEFAENVEIIVKCTTQQ